MHPDLPNEEVKRLEVPREFELTVFGSFLAEGRQDFAVDVKDLNAVVVGVRDDDPVGAANGDVVRMFELTGSVSQTAKLADKGAIRLEDLDAMVFLVADVDEP